jgi:DNA replication protein DnaC
MLLMLDSSLLKGRAMMDPDEMNMIELDEEGQLVDSEVVFEVDKPEHRELTRIVNITPSSKDGEFSARLAVLQAKIRERRVLEKDRIRQLAAIPADRVGPKPPQAPVYPKHPVCGHELNDEVKYTTRSTYPVMDEMTGVPRWNQLVPCPHCTEEIRRSRAAKTAARNIERLFGGANIPRYAEDWSFETVPSSVDVDAVEAMIDYTNMSIEKMGRGKAGISILLHGETNAGKTGLAISAMNKFIAAGIACFLVYMTEYFSLIYQGMDKNAPPELAQLEQSAKSVPVLVMDDLSSENPTRDTLKRILLLIEHRTARGLTTIITSNNSLEALETYWYLPNLGEEVQQQSGRILRRIQERFKMIALQPRGKNPGR